MDGFTIILLFVFILCILLVTISIPLMIINFVLRMLKKSYAKLFRRTAKV